MKSGFSTMLILHCTHVLIIWVQLYVLYSTSMYERDKTHNVYVKCSNLTFSDHTFTKCIDPAKNNINFWSTTRFIRQVPWCVLYKQLGSTHGTVVVPMCNVYHTTYSNFHHTN